MVWPLHLPPFPSHRAFFGTARSGQGRAGCARRRRIFCGVEKIVRSEPLRARTVLEHGAEGKGGQAADTFEDAGVITAGCSCSGSTHEFCYRTDPNNDRGCSPAPNPSRRTSAALPTREL